VGLVTDGNKLPVIGANITVIGAAGEQLQILTENFTKHCDELPFKIQVTSIGFVKE
jgi:hypothetical protein